MTRLFTRILHTCIAAVTLFGLAAYTNESDSHSEGMMDGHDGEMHQESTDSHSHEDADTHGDSDHAESGSAADHGSEGHHGSTEEEKPTDARSVKIVATDFTFDPATITAKSGEKLYIILVNQGNAVHMWQIEGMPKTHVHTKPGETSTKVITAPAKSGRYKVVCQTAGHAKLGMVGTLKVGE